MNEISSFTATDAMAILCCLKEHIGHSEMKKLCGAFSGNNRIVSIVALASLRHQIGDETIYLILS